MKNKPGMKIKLGSEEILYLVIGVIIVVFIMFMPTIYKFISDVKTGNAFKGKDNQTVEQEETNKKENSKEEEKEEQLTGDTSFVCTLSNSTADGNYDEIYTFYFNSDKLSSIELEKKYDGSTDEYLNYIYSEQAKFNNINELHKAKAGFSYTSKLEGKSFDAIFKYDLTKIRLDSLSNENEDLNINLNVTENQSSDEVKTQYLSLGYTCE